MIVFPAPLAHACPPVVTPQIKDMAESKRVNNAIRSSEAYLKAAGETATVVDPSDALPFQAVVMSGHFWPTLNVRVLSVLAVNPHCAMDNPLLTSDRLCSWSQVDVATVKLHSELQHRMDAYQHAYSVLKKPRKLVLWCSHFIVCCCC
jgi:hypothetical protein